MPKCEGQRFAARLGVLLHGGLAPVRGRRSVVGGARAVCLRTMSPQMRRGWWSLATG